MGDLDFNSDEQPTISMDFEPIPAGKYKMQVAEATVSPTSKGGLMLKCVLELLGGEFDGRRIFENFNLRNDSEKAQAIGRGMLSSLCKAIGKVGMVENSVELLQRPFIGKVKIEEGSGGYGPRNSVKAFYPIDKNAPVKDPTPKTTDKVDEDDIPF